MYVLGGELSHIWCIGDGVSISGVADNVKWYLIVHASVSFLYLLLPAII